MGILQPIVQGQLPTGDYKPLQVDASGNLKITGGSGGGGGDVRITDGTVTTTITDVSGKKSLDVNVTNITLSSLDDSVAVKGTNNNSIEPTANGSLQTAIDGLLERMVLKAISRLTFASSGELRTQFTNTLPTGTNSIGTVGINANQIVAVAGSTNYGASQLLSQQCFQESFRRNLVVT